MTASPPGWIASASRASSRSTAPKAPASPSSHASTRITSGSSAIRRAVSGSVDLHRRIGDLGALAAAAEAHVLEGVAEPIDGDVEERRGRGIRRAQQSVRSAARDEGGTAGFEGVPVGADLEDAASREYDRQRHVAGEVGELDAPGRGELGAAVERPAEAEQVQAVAELVAGRDRGERRSCGSGGGARIDHESTVACRAAERPDDLDVRHRDAYAG